MAKLEAPSNELGAPTAAEGHEYLGYKQPPVNQRLLQCKNFLSDEDPDRYLHFKDKFREIEDYIIFLETATPQLLHDAKLLAEVKIMVAAHRDWQTRQKEYAGPILTNCSDLDMPTIHPYSTRLVNVETVRMLENERPKVGLGGQNREDSNVFSYSSTPDHDEFLKRMREGTAQDPAELNTEGTLGCIESRAYEWALHDPALISHWMHPTKGIPNKPLSLLDNTRWYKDEKRAISITARKRPARTWLPDYLIAREKRINELLGISRYTTGEWEELELLLCPHEPRGLNERHLKYINMERRREWGYSISEEVLQKLSGSFVQDFTNWIAIFRADGVQLMVRHQNDDVVESKEPGVFYVDDGSLSNDVHNRAAILQEANWLLSRYRSPEEGSLTAFEHRDLEIYLERSNPLDILKLQMERDALVHNDNVTEQNSVRGVPRNSRWQVLNIKIAESKRLRKEALKTSSGKFHYIRPGEMFDPETDDLYLDWGMTCFASDISPSSQSTIELTADAAQLERLINQALRAGIAPDLETGNVTLALLLQQVAYPELRALLIPYLALRLRNAEATVTNQEVTLFQILRPIVTRLWNSWIAGFEVKPGVSTVRVLMTRETQRPERPNVFYCRSQDPNHKSTICKRDLVKINRLLKIDTNAFDSGACDSHFHQLETLIPREHFYPALLRSRDADSSTIGSLNNKFRFKQWLESKAHQEMIIQTRDDNLDPDDDPTIVYFLGPLPTLDNLKAVMPAEILYLIRNSIPQQTDIEIADHAFKLLSGTNTGDDYRPHLHPILQDYLRYAGPDHNERPSAAVCALTCWFFHAIQNTYTPRAVDALDTLSRSDALQYVDEVDKDFLVVDESIQKQSRLERAAILAAQQKKLQSSQPQMSRQGRRIQRKRVFDSDRVLYVAKINENHTPLANLVSVGKLAKTIEIELNRVLQILSDSECTASVKALQNTTFDQARARMYLLLPQFMPTRIFEKWSRYRRSAAIDGNDNNTPALDVLEEEYSSELVPWVRGLGAAGVSVLLPGETAVASRRSQGRANFYCGDHEATELYFQERSFRFAGTRDEVLNITAPNVDQEFYDAEDQIQKSEILKFTLSKFEQPLSGRNLSAKVLRPSRAVTATEETINELLSRRHALTWDESERLITLLRPIMPIDLVRQDEELLTLDNTSRTASKFTVEQTGKFWDLWEKWRVDYSAWLATVPDEIHINQNIQADNNYSADQRFNANNLTSDQLRRNIRLRSLPEPVVKITNNIKTLLQDPENITSKNLSTELWHFLKAALGPLYRPNANEIRRILKLKIKNNFCDEDARYEFLDPEDTVLIDVVVDIAYVNFLFHLSALSTPTKPIIEMIEPVPGLFELRYIGKESMTDISAEEIVEILFMEHVHPDTGLTQHKKRFHDIARHIRRDEPLTPAETLFVQQQLRLLDTSEQLEIMLKFQKLVATAFLQEDLPPKEHLKYVTMETALFWSRWLHDFPDLADKVGTRQRFVDPADDLLSRNLGDSRRYLPGPPIIATPGAIEASEVEIELNNLLNKERKGTAGPKEIQALNYFLIGLTPQDLRVYKDTVDFQEQKYITQGGLDVKETVEFLSREEGFKYLFAKFKARLPKHGIRLNTTWFSRLQIGETCSRARHWKKHTKNSDGTYNYPLTSNFIEDFALRTWRNHLLLLEKMVDRAWTAASGLQAIFLWKFLPGELRNLKQYLENPSSKSFSDEFSKTTDPVVRKRDFVHQYMCWLCGFSPNEIEDMMQKVGASDVHHDFTPKAERRGVKRACIELALNHLATNQEQHRPDDRFRVVDIDGQPLYKPEKGVRISLPLEPWKRPLEQDPLEYTKKMAIYRQWRDSDYAFARERIKEKQISIIQTPANYLGPFALADGDTYKEGSRKLQARLAGIALMMQEAQSNAPRPLMQQLLSRFSEGLNPVNHRKNGGIHPLDDDVPLTDEGLDLLVSISGESWDESGQDFPETNLSSLTQLKRAQFEEFVRDIEALWGLIPEWISPQSTSRNDENQHIQRHHDPSFQSHQQGISMKKLMVMLNEKRQSHNPPLYPWTSEGMSRNLWIMHLASRLYCYGYPPDGDVHLPEVDWRVWRIPLTGHPENRYVTTPTIHPQHMPAGVRLSDPSSTAPSQAVVTYDANANEGAPIWQPSKIKYLQQLAYRLGRDSRNCLDTATGDYLPTTDCLVKQVAPLYDTLKAMEDITQEDRAELNPGAIIYDPEIYTLKQLALDLHKIAPDLAREAEMVFPNGDSNQMRETQAAQIIQMQIIEEVSNNWELRFPENEHVWNFADQRIREAKQNTGERIVKTKPRKIQFFSLRRFPLCCQSDNLKSLIMNSGPVVQEKPVPEESSRELTRTELQTDDDEDSKPPPKTDRHIRGQRPMFPFGETPYQAAYQSFRMEQDLKDVPEFQIPKKKMSLIPSIFRKKNPDDDIPYSKIFGLPDLPEYWEPGSISIAAKKAQMIEIAKRTPGMPDSSIPEHYHNQREIEVLHRQEAWDTHVQRVAVANQAIANLTGKEVKKLTAKELNQARMELGIDLTMGTMRDVPPSATAHGLAPTTELGVRGILPPGRPAGHCYIQDRAHAALSTPLTAIPTQVKRTQTSYNESSFGTTFSHQASNALATVGREAVGSDSILESMTSGRAVKSSMKRGIDENSKGQGKGKRAKTVGFDFI